MVMISLRDYYREIESLIEAAQNDEAIFHCMVILQSYPKSIETYRNLGKSLLESKRYAEAAEVFSKILSVFPDDFITHVGLSVIKEEERDLDAAIWHMEQAFELQPSNLALQEELRRLFGRRDGVPPTKIRLTRGALVKMYARGELHQQAIAEIKSVLKDEPSRIDYQALLAKMYMVSGAHADAVEIASSIVESYPYCFEANKILDELLSNTETKGETNIYRARLIELEPYYQFVDALTPNVADVPDEKVIIEKKVYSGSQEGESGVSDWTKQIDLNWRTKDIFVESESFDLLNQVEAFNGEAKEPTLVQPVSPFIGDIIPELENQANQSEKEPDSLPDWITKAGWTRSTESSNAEIERNALREVEEDHQEKAVPSNELPDWLKSLSASNGLQNKESDDQKSSGASEEQSDAFSNEHNTAEDSSEELPEWLSSISPVENVNESHEEKNRNDSLPGSNHEAATPSEELPDWLTTLTPADDSTNYQPNEEVAPDFSSENNEPLTPPEDLPDWLKSLSDEEQSAAEATIEKDNLAGSSFEEEIIEDEPLSSDELKEAIENWGEEAVPEAELRNSEEKEIPSDDHGSDWLNQFITNNESIEDSQRNENLPDWLKSFGSEDKKQSSEESDQPDWLSSLQDQQHESEDEVTIEKGLVDSGPILEPEIIQSIDDIDDILGSISSDQPEADNNALINSLSESTLPQEISEDQIETEEKVSEKEAPETKTTIPSWVKNILSTAASTENVPPPTPIASEEHNIPAPTPESVIADVSKENEEEIIEPLLSDLPDQASHIGAISSDSKDELLSWLHEVNPSDEEFKDEAIEPKSSGGQFVEPESSNEPSVEDMVRDNLLDIDQPEENFEMPVEEIPGSDFEDRLSELLEQPVDENLSIEEIEDSIPIATEETNIEKNVDQIESELSIKAEVSEITFEKINQPSDQNFDETDLLKKIESIGESEDCKSLPSLVDESIKFGLSPEKIIEALESLSQKQQNSYEIWQTLGDLYLSESNFEKALKAYNIAESTLQN